jgi:predicted nucleic acid-binding protein
MKPLVVDTSVIVKWFLPEEDSEQALLLRDSYLEGSLALIAPDLMLSELANVLWKRRDLIDKDTSLLMLGDLLALGIDIVPSEGLVALAYSLAWQYDRTVYDSLYLALAKSKNCRMITADERLYNAVGASLPFVSWLREWQPEEAA